MLHWPDSMFTYVREAKTLLPNDAFGQHLASSKRFADELDMSVVMDEASKYYANILMPFGGQIQKMLAKIEEMGLEIEAIGPSHGSSGGARRTWPASSRPTRIGVGAGTGARRPHLRHHVAFYREDDHGHSRRRIAGGGRVQGAQAQRHSPVGGGPPGTGVARLLNRHPYPQQPDVPTVGGFLTYIKGLRPSSASRRPMVPVDGPGAGSSRWTPNCASWGWRSWIQWRSSTCPAMPSWRRARSLGGRWPAGSRRWESETVAMKVLGLAGSPRRGGNTETLLDWCLDAAREEGATVTKFNLCDLDLRGCRACEACFKDGVCIQKDEMHKLYPHLRTATPSCSPRPYTSRGCRRCRRWPSTAASRSGRSSTC